MKGRKRNPLSAENSVSGFAGGDQCRLYSHKLITHTEKKRVAFKQLG